jgi:hypothetical protein
MTWVERQDEPRAAATGSHRLVAIDGHWNE